MMRFIPIFVKKSLSANDMSVLLTISVIEFKASDNSLEHCGNCNEKTAIKIYFHASK